MEKDDELRQTLLLMRMENLSLAKNGMEKDDELRQTLLLVDDNNSFRERLSRALTKRGYIVFDASDYDEAIEIVKEQQPELAVFDLKMPGKSGLELLKEAKRLCQGMRVVVLTGYGSIATATEAIRLGALNYIPKPADVDDILNVFSKDPDSGVVLGEEEFIPPTLARAEWEHINRVLADCNNNISEAARKLGLHRRTLQRKLFKYAPK